MINASFYISNPVSKQDYKNIYSTGGPLLKNKYWELNVEKSSCIFGSMLSVAYRQSHAGVFFDLALFGYGIDFGFYDVRHWDYEKNQWCIYPEDKDEK